MLSSSIIYAIYGGDPFFTTHTPYDAWISLHLKHVQISSFFDVVTIMGSAALITYIRPQGILGCL